MPNLHWFGTEDDHAEVLSAIFALDAFEVFELYSRPGQPIRVFSSVDEALEEFQVPHSDGTPKEKLHLNLWVKGSGPKPHIERVELQPQKENGHNWMERSGADGFVRFYLERFVDKGLMYSQTNTPSEARMGAIDGIVTSWDGALLDVRKSNRMSSKLNRLIKKRAVAKIGAMPMLSGANALWDEGVTFGYHWSKTKTPDLRNLA